jgi:hypothetical protein
MPDLWNIVISVIAGLITASFLLILKSLFINSFVPWYRHVMYKGLRFEGVWYEYRGNQKVLLEIKQGCDTLTGKATVHSLEEMNDHFDNLKTFDVKGYIKGRFIILTWEHTDKSRIGIVTQLLQVTGDGTTVNGTASWYAPRMSEIISGEVKYYRAEDAARKYYQYSLDDNEIEEEQENINTELEYG